MSGAPGVCYLKNHYPEVTLEIGYGHLHKVTLLKVVPGEYGRINFIANSLQCESKLTDCVIKISVMLCICSLSIFLP